MNIDDVLCQLVRSDSWSDSSIKVMRERARNSVEQIFKKYSSHDLETDPLIQQALELFGGETKGFSIGGKEFLVNPGAEDPPDPPVPVIEKTWWEYVIKQRDNIVAFVDYAVAATMPVLVLGASTEDTGSPTWYVHYEKKKIFFEAKVTINSIGHLMRQLRAYEHYQPGLYVVVSPDDRSADILREQGVAFIKCPEPEQITHGQQKLFN